MVGDFPPSSSETFFKFPADALVKSSFEPEKIAEEDPLISRRKKVTG